MNERLPEEAWYGFLQIVAEDDRDVDEGSVDIGDPDEVGFGLFLCERDGEWEVDDDGFLENDDNCYISVDGDVDITRSDDGRVINLRSDGDVDFDDFDRRDEGELTFSIQLTECEDMVDEVERLFE